MIWYVIDDESKWYNVHDFHNKIFLNSMIIDNKQ